MIRLVLLSAVLVAFTFAQSPNDPNYIVLPVVVHDYYPCATNEWSTPLPNMTLDNCQHDVEPYQTSSTRWGSGLGTANTGMVSSTLSPNRKPIYILGEAPNGVTSSRYQTLNATTYARWWDSSWPGNWPISYNLTLQLDPKTGLYQINTGAFYPIDNRGWGNNGIYPEHNWGFCVEAHAAFIYNSSATLSFEGDDDLWIFLNNQLIFDIGGIHTPVKQTTKLGDVAWATPMKDFASYPFDMFYCERQTAGSDLILTSTVNIYCPNNQYDACGVCQGKGDCCTDKCIPKDACTIGTLNPQNCNCTYDSISKYSNCAAQSTACVSVQCDGQNLGNSGNCVSKNRQGPSYTGCQLQTCDPVKGFQTVNYNPCPQNANATCYPNTCVVSGSNYTCNNSTANQCVGACVNVPCPKLPCSTFTCTNVADGDAGSESGRKCSYTSTLPENTLCTNYTCAADNVTIVSTPVVQCTNSSNLCFNSTCDPDLGKCTDRIYLTCNDNNACTTDSCVEATGQCQFITNPLPSQNNTCVLASCDPVYGVTASNVSCKGIRCTQNPNAEGCCQCEGIPLVAVILGTGAIVGIAVGGAAALALAGIGGKAAHSYFAANSAAAAGIQDNPMYVANQSGGDNPMYAT